jgi:hypothetical protein
MAAVAGVLASVGAVTAPAPAQNLARLPGTATPPAAGPPLTTTATPLELRFPGRIASRERVIVELGPTGMPVGIRVRQRLVLRGTGDYSLSVQAPLISVARAPGSESEPGGRTGVLLWQGFSAGRRVLEADADLHVAPASRALPLRFQVRRGPRGRELVVRNVTRSTLYEPGFTGRVTSTDAAGALDELRAALRNGWPAGDHFVTVAGLRPGGRLHAEVPMRVSGTVRVAGRTSRFGRVVRGDDPLVLSLASRGRVDVTATAVPVPPLAALRPPAGSSWSEAARANRIRGGARLLALALATRLDAARYRQFSQFLANPDRLGQTRAVYVFESRPGARAAPAPPADRDDASQPLLGAVLALGSVAGVLGLVVWWAHS